MSRLIKSIKNSTIFKSISKREYLDSDTGKTEIVKKNFFLHFHPVKVNKHSLKWNYTFGLGVISVFLFLILCVTGILLMFWYTPSVDRAYDDMLDIKYVVSYGNVVRNMHRWAAHAMVIIVFLHLCRVFYTASYKKPREFNWLIGTFLFILTLLLSYTGYLLPWDQLSFWGVRVGIKIIESAPVGKTLSHFIIGGDEIGQPTLIRFYVLHCILLPLFMLLLVFVHIWRIRKDGGLSFPKNEAVKKVFTWPHLVTRESALFFLIISLLLIFSLLFDAPLKEKANSITMPNPMKAPWYFLGIQEMCSWTEPIIGGFLVPIAIIILLLILPYIDKNPDGVGVWFSKKRLFITILFSIIVLALIICTIIGTFFRGKDWELLL